MKAGSRVWWDTCLPYGWAYGEIEEIIGDGSAICRIISVENVSDYPPQEEQLVPIDALYESGS